MTLIRTASLSCLALTCAAALPALGQEFPTKPVHILTSEAGGGLDFGARLLGQGMSQGMGQQVIVENKGGAGGILAIETVARAAPDGYSLVYYGSNIWLDGFLSDHSTWDPIKDFAPITITTSGPNFLVVHPSVPANNVKELIALAKAKPGVLNYGGGAAGASTHLSAELFKAMAGVDIVRIPFKGTGPAINALIAGQVQVMFSTPVIVPHIKSGRVRALAVTSARPSALMPQLPTIAESGIPGYESVSLSAVFAPAKTPAAIISRLNQEMVRALNRPDIKEKFLSAGVEVVGSTPEQLLATEKSEMARMGKVIRDAGIRAD
jgi:tripartite-type tricarboxylate transporter receptor subunit TctC